MNTHDIETVLRSYLTGDGYIAADDIPAICAAIDADRQRRGEVVVTKDDTGAIVAVTRQDEEGRILSVIAEADRKRGGEPECNNCGGTGDVSGEYPGVACPACAGTGIAPQPAVPAQVQHVDDINVADIPAVSAEHATLNLQPSSSMQPVATAFFTEKGEVAFTGLFDRTLKALEAVKTTRMGISSGSIDLYAAPQPAERDPTLPYEQALSELIDKIIPGLDSGDILADAQTASAALTAEPVKH